MVKSRKNKFRWFILGLLFIATTILYIDRSALGILAPYLQEDMGWSEVQYGIINSMFMIAYAIGFIAMGRIIDKMNTRKGYLISIGIWSLAALSHGLATSWIGFLFARFFLGIGQSGNFPSAIKAVSEWFPKKERALAISIFNGGANLGTFMAPLIIPSLVLTLSSWKVGFCWTFPLSLIWFFVWLKYYRKPTESKYVSEQELQLIHSDKATIDLVQENTTKKISWKNILTHRETWGIAIAKFIADPIWWFYMFWGAKYLNQKFGTDLAEIGLPFFTIYFVSWGIGVFLGWLSSKLMKGSFSHNKGRKYSLLACAVFAVPVIFVPHVSNMWTAVGLITLAAGGHCGWSANIFSLISDVFPNKAVGTVTGFAGFAGAVGGAIIAYLVGNILQNVGVAGYVIPFGIAGLGYLIALCIIHLLIPKITSINI